MERYIDPSSGAAPQPGGVFYSTEALAEVSEEEAVNAKSLETQAIDPSQEEEKQEETKEEGDGPTESEASDAKALETEGIDLQSDDENDDETEEEGEEEGEEAEAYDPKDYTVTEVLAYVKDNPEEKDAIIASERAGKNRDGITKLAD